MPTIEENKILVGKYPWLIPPNKNTGKLPENYDYSKTVLDAMPTGWRIAFGDLLCEDIQKELEKFDYADKFVVVQLKQKMGDMRLYHNGVPTGCNVGKIIEAYSVLSQYICIDCGELDVPQTHGWVEPICKECVKSYRVKDPEKYWNDLYEEQKPCTLPEEYSYRVWNMDADDWEVVTVDVSDKVKRIRKKYYGRKQVENK